MKKNKIIFMIVMIVLLFPSIAMADMGAPMSILKVKISNPEGAYFYEYDLNQKGYIKTEQKLEYDVVVNVGYELNVDNQKLAFVCVVNNNSSSSDRICGNINLVNTKAVEINLDDYYHESALTYLVFDDSCYLYTGPSYTVYEKVSPQTVMEVGYSFSSNYYDDVWIYVPELKAWVYRYAYGSSGLLNISSVYKNDIMTIGEVKIYDNPKTKENVLGVIPANTKITPSYLYYITPKIPFYYITYNGVTGFIETVYNSEKKVITNFAYEVSNVLLKVNNNDGIKLYKENDLLSDVLTVIPNGVELSPSYSFRGFYDPSMYRVEYNNQVGWVKYEDFYPSNNENDLDDLSDKDDQIIEGDHVIEDDLIENEEPEIIYDDTDGNLTIKKTIFLCVISVLLVCLSAFVLILFVNKKKEQKNDK